MSCPRCSTMLDLDPDGGWCPQCKEYFPPDILMQYLEEDDPIAFHDTEGQTQ